MDNIIITNVTDLAFRLAFVQYFKEFGYSINVEHDIFLKMKENDRDSILALYEGEKIYAFIMLKIEVLTNWFFTERVLLIREFWVEESKRKQGIGSRLLKESFCYARDNQIHKLLLTTDSAEEFYVKQGFVFDASYTAKNGDKTYIKILAQEANL